MTARDVPLPLNLPAPAATITRWTHRHPVMDVRVTVIDERTGLYRTEWRPADGTGPWLPVNRFDLERLYVEINPEPTP